MAANSRPRADWSPASEAGSPRSPPSRTCGSRSTEPRKVMLNCFAVCSVAPAPKTSITLPSGRVIWLMFSTMPRTSTLTWWNISSALRASCSATLEPVELAPGDLLEKLLDDAVQHRPAHHHRLVAG